jgi:mannose-6-phosphate isomerase-like protein (cupin superfamily)
MDEMPDVVKLERISIAEHVARLSEPFTMVDLAQVDDLVLSVYVCQGTMPVHRHLDQDELFLVHSGTISLESDWGTVVLRPGELAVAPKGVGHRSSSIMRSHVVLLQPRLLVNRRNGDRRLFAIEGAGRLQKISLPAMGRQIAIPFRRVSLVSIDCFDLYLMLCKGPGPWLQTERQPGLIVCWDGQLDVETRDSGVSLDKGELTVIAKEVDYKLSGRGRTLALGVERHDQPGLPLE